jgi:hypothetical protein
MHFSEVYRITPGPDDDWFDTYLPSDSKLCVDPFLIYESGLPEWAGAHDRILDFFAMTFELIRRAGGNKSSNPWRVAEHLLLFPEPSEFCLGVAEGSPLGAGSGPKLRAEMFDAISAAVRYGLTNIEHMEMLALFHGGMGLDRISDVVCNILKSDFIRYTQNVCARHGVPMRTFRVKHADWSEESLRWKDARIDLPANPFLPEPIPVLLTPDSFLKDIPVVTADEFWAYAWANHGEELRDTFNYDIARKVPRRVKARLARRNVSIVEDYLHSLEAVKHDPYPVNSDPGMLLNWYDAGAGMVERNTDLRPPADPAQFKDFAIKLIELFKHSIQDQGDWELLWVNGVPRKERVAQKLFQSVVVHYCRANNIDLSSEPNAGRGPVDFKFSNGWTARALVEMKLMRNTKFWDGILAQVPQYARSEEIRAAFFVAIAYADHELTPERERKISRAAALASERNSIEVIPIIIDARRPTSSSKLRATDEERQALADGAAVDPDEFSDEAKIGPDDPEEVA